MEIKNILKIGLFVISTSIFFTACANKSIEKKVEKWRILEGYGNARKD